MRTTQKDIAEKLNVSVMTVSKALKGHPDISEKTRRLVQKTAREMDYTINVVARSLVQKKTNTIGVVIPDISEPFYAETLRGIEAYVRDHRYNVILADSDSDPKIESQALQMMREKRVDGLLFCPTEKSDEYIQILKNITIPYVLINNIPSQLPCDSISVDRALGAYYSISYLLEQGYEEIYFFYTYKHMAQSRQSIDGCYRAFDELKKVRKHLKLVYCPEHNLKTFYTMAKEQVYHNDKKIGIFAWDDEMAIGIYRAVVEMGMQIPEQVGLIGFDDIKISNYLPQALTTIKYPKFEMGQRGAERLIQRLNSKRKLPPKHIQLTLTLVKRETA
jgi:LacI family transcriptional regulator